MENEPRKHGKKRVTKKQRQKRKVILAVVAVVVALILGVVAFVASKFAKLDSVGLKNIKINKLSKETEEGMKGYTTLALFGLDNRSNGNFERGNSDTIIVVSINKENGEIKMASVYRDTYLEVSEDKFRKANAAYAAGGPEQAINMLNKNLDLDIEDYVTVDFNAVVDAVDLLGGVELDITEDEVRHMNSYIDSVSDVTGKRSSHVGAGTQLCDGVQATAYARIRYTVGWDFKRTERQRTVVTKMFEKAKQADLLTLNSLVDEMLPEISTSLSSAEILGLAADAMKFKMGENTGFPFENQGGTVGELGDLVIPVNLEDNVIQLHQFLYANEKYVPSQTVKDISATIHNNSGI